MRCTAHTAAGTGKPCRRQAMAGREVCHAHSGAKVGRPSALTPEVHERIVKLVKVGCSGELAARAAGISPTTYYEIKRRGREAAEGPERELLEAIEQGQAEACAHAVANWRRDMAQPGNWRANVAYIDRFDRGRFRDRGEGDGGSTARSDGHDRSTERRPDLSKLSEATLSELEGLYADGSQDGAPEQ